MSKDGQSEVAKLAAGRKVLVRKKLKSESSNERFLRANVSDAEDSQSSTGDTPRTLDSTSSLDSKPRRKRSTKSPPTEDGRRATMPEDESPHLAVSDGEAVTRLSDAEMKAGRRWTVSDADADADLLSVRSLTTPGIFGSSSMTSIPSLNVPPTRHGRALSDAGPGRAGSTPPLSGKSPHGGGGSGVALLGGDPQGVENTARHMRSLMLMEKMRHQRSELLTWVREEVKPYGIEVSGLEALADGVVFLALLNNYDPSILDFDSFDKSDRHRTLEAALSIAEDRLGIPNLLDVESVIYDHRSLLLYLAHFKTRLDDLKREANPLGPALKAANEVKFLVEKRFETLKDLQTQFDEEILRLAALSSQDELEAEKVYHQQKSESASRTIEASRHLVGKLEERNGILRSQNELLSEKVSVLEKLLESERATRKRLEDELVLSEKIKALGALLEPQEVDLASLYNKLKGDLEPLRPKKSSPTLSASGNVDKPQATKE